MRFLIRTEIETAPCSLNQECVAGRYLDDMWAAGQVWWAGVGRRLQLSETSSPALEQQNREGGGRGHSESAEPKAAPGIKHLWIFTH